MHLERLAVILEIVGQRGQATVADICEHSDLPKPSAYRLVQDLTAAGLLEATARGRFAIGARLRRITARDHSDPALVEIVAPEIARAATQHGAAFFLSRLRGHRVEIIHVATPDTGVSYLHPGIGKRPLHACSCAKAIAAFSPDILSSGALSGQLRQYTEHTITSREGLEAELRSIRQRGFAECVEELERGICSVATTLAETGPGATLSIGATGSTRVFTPAARDRIGQALIRLSRELARSLNVTGPDTDRKSA